MARGIGQHAGGAYDGGCQQDIIDADSVEGPIVSLLGAADALNPHVAGNYIVSKAGVDTITLGVPTVGSDDNLTVNIWSDTANAHTVTLPSASYATGAGMKTVATFAAARGAGISLRAFNGVWQVLGQSGITFT